MLIDLINLLKKFEFKNIFSIEAECIRHSKNFIIFEYKGESSLSDLEITKMSKVREKIRLTSIPTTCGTGAEVTQFQQYGIEHN